MIEMIGALLIGIILIQQFQISRLQKIARWLVSHTRLSNDVEIGDEGAEDLLEYIVHKEE